ILIMQQKKSRVQPFSKTFLALFQIIDKKKGWRAGSLNTYIKNTNVMIFKNSEIINDSLSIKASH
ncbi:MAG: hypothetical protein ABSA82_06885, partial [Thermacetogeniaceae bacterium]